MQLTIQFHFTEQVFNSRFELPFNDNKIKYWSHIIGRFLVKHIFMNEFGHNFQQFPLLKNPHKNPTSYLVEAGF